MRILSLHTDALSGRGGIARYNRDLLEALAAHEAVDLITVIARTDDGSSESVPDKIRYRPNGNRGRAGFVAATLRELATPRRYDLVLCAHANLLPVAVLAKAAHRTRLLLMAYGIEVWRPHASRLVNACVPRIDAVASISALSRDKLYAWSTLAEQPCYILPNAVDPAQYTPAPPDPAVVDRYALAGHEVLLTVGRLNAAERYKGIDEVLERLPGLAEAHPRIRYVVVGDGDDLPRLKARARALGVERLVVFAGYVGEADKIALYRAANAYVMPGRGEGFGFVYLEAMACGLPVVASTLDGSREAVREGALGLLVNPDRPGELQTAIESVLQGPRGHVPEGLSFFYPEAFRRRCHDMLDDLRSRFQLG